MNIFTVRKQLYTHVFISLFPYTYFKNCRWGSVSYVAFLLLQSDFNGLPVGTYQAFPNIHPPQIPATPPSYESVSLPSYLLFFFPFSLKQLY